MLLKGVVEIRITKTWLNWLRKWAMSPVADDKVSSFSLQAANSLIKKITSFYLIRLHLKKILDKGANGTVFVACHEKITCVDFFGIFLCLEVPQARQNSEILLNFSILAYWP